MKPFAQYLEEKKSLPEAVTIPEDPSDKIEMALRQKMKKGWTHGDRAIRWYRNAKKIGTSPQDLQRQFVSDFSNIEDLLKTYDKYLADLKRMKLTSQKVQISFAGGKTLEVDPVKDVDKIRRLEGFQMLVKAMGDLVHSDTAIDTSIAKYALSSSDRKKIKILGSTSNVVLWQTQGYETTNKFVYQLWQNAESLGHGAVYGQPEEQSPYCTHSKQHWDDYSQGFGEDYKQFWFLQKTGPCPAGDLTNAGTVKAFNMMKGKGPKILIAMNDSNNDMLDKYDHSVNEDAWIAALLPDSETSVHTIAYPDEVIDLTKRFLVHMDNVDFIPLKDRLVIDPDLKAREGSSSRPREIVCPESWKADKLDVNIWNIAGFGVKSYTEMQKKISGMHFPKNVEVSRFILTNAERTEADPIVVQNPPGQIKAVYATLGNIIFQRKVEITASRSVSLVKLPQETLDNLTIKPKASTLYIEVNNCACRDLSFLPFKTTSLGLLKTGGLQSCDGAPVDMRTLRIHDEDGIILKTQKQFDGRDVHLFEYWFATGALNFADDSWKALVRSTWSRDGRFYSILDRLNRDETALQATIAYLMLAMRQGKPGDLYSSNSIDALDAKAKKDYFAKHAIESNGASQRSIDRAWDFMLGNNLV